MNSFRDVKQYALKITAHDNRFKMLKYIEALMI